MEKFIKLYACLCTQYNSLYVIDSQMKAGGESVLCMLLQRIILPGLTHGLLAVEGKTRGFGEIITRITNMQWWFYND